MSFRIFGRSNSAPFTFFCALLGGFCFVPSDALADALDSLNPNGRRVQGADGSTQIEFRVQQGELLLDDRRKKRRLSLASEDLARVKPTFPLTVSHWCVPEGRARHRCALTETSAVLTFGESLPLKTSLDRPSRFHWASSNLPSPRKATHTSTGVAILSWMESECS